MNLHINLIMPGEQRSAHPINLRSLSRIGTIVGPSVLVLLAFLWVLNWLTLSNKVRIAESVWQELEPRKEAAIELRNRYQTNQAILRELEGWRAARILWNRQLGGIRTAVPADMQLLSLRVNQVLQVIDKKNPARVFSMTIEGRAEGNNADADVLDLQLALRIGKPFEDVVEEVNVPRFAADPDNRMHRLFQIECNYEPRFFKDENP